MCVSKSIKPISTLNPIIALELKVQLTSEQTMNIQIRKIIEQLGSIIFLSQWC